MKITKFTGGLLESNGYILQGKTGNDCLILDPGYNSRAFLTYLEEHHLHLQGILLTHHHYDHSGVAQRIRAKHPCPVYLHENDANMYKGHVDVYLRDGDQVGVGNEFLRVIHTPGHTHGSCAFLLESENLAFTGDAVFEDEVGRFDLEDGDETETQETIRTIFETWPDDRILYPGHGDPMTMNDLRTANEEYRMIAGRNDNEH